MEEKLKFRKILLPIIFVLSLGIFYFLGYLHGHANLVFSKKFVPQITNTELGKPKDIDFSLFWEVWNKVEDQYPGKVDRKKIFYGAISGILTGLDDPYSVFMEPGQSKTFLNDLEGIFDGIGVEITMKNNQITIVSALKDTPASKAGLMANDIILKIDGKETTNMTLDEVVNKIRGVKGTKVTLTIYRNGKQKDYTVTRDKIKVESVKYEFKDSNIAYIKIDQFGDDTEDLFNKAISEIQLKKPKGIILDLRDNPGGYLETSVNIASAFIKNGVIVSEQYKGDKKDEYKSTGDGRLEGYKLVVLVNGGSASASEIVAGAIQDLGKGKLIGEKTFRKGSVQELEALKDEAYLRLTVAKWLTPKGRYINSSGIEPDIVVEMTQKDIDADRDPQLDRALSEIKK